jgi:hypothetical protein
MKNDQQGTSTCARGAEQYETYYSSIHRALRVQYDYRTPDGRCFSCVAHSLAEAREKRDQWLKINWEI